MSKKQVIDPEEFRSSFIFHKDEDEKDTYYCRCGHVNKKKRDAGMEEVKVQIREGQEFDLADVFDKATKGVNLMCGKCDLDYSDKNVYNRIFPVDKYFFEQFKFEEDEQNLHLYKARLAANHVSHLEDLRVEQRVCYIRLEKNTKRLFFKDFTGQEKEFGLNMALSISKKMFANGTSEITDGLFEVHLYLNRLANFVSDTRNMNIVGELLSQMVGRPGFDPLIKVSSIFYGVISYPNLSTIALTKGTVFIYDMLSECNLPNISELTDAGATSPLKIFNFLVNNTNKQLQEELDAEEKAGYTFTSKGKIASPVYFDVERYMGSGNLSSKKGEVFVREDIKNIKVSPYIYNSIRRFDDYRRIVKYTQWMKYEQLIVLVQRHDLELLLRLLDIIEFRAGNDFERISQFIDIAKSFIIRWKSKPNTRDLKFIRMQLDEGDIMSDAPEEIVEISNTITAADYNTMAHFSLDEYDDALRMLNDLKWDANKEFYKIKNITELEDYHGQLVEHYNLLSSAEKNQKYIDSVNRFKFIEGKFNDLTISLIRTPDSLLYRAKQLRNCAGSYVTRVANGQYVLAMVSDTFAGKRNTNDHELYMLGLIVTKSGLEFDQVKAACNKQGSDRFKQEMMLFLEEKDISYKDISDLRLSTTTLSENVQAMQDMQEDIINNFQLRVRGDGPVNDLDAQVDGIAEDEK